MQSKERQDRKQRKDSSHWAQETAEKALLKEHADQDQHQKNNAWNIRGKSEISRMQHGKDIPRACSSCFLINSCKAAKGNQKQNAVFDQYQFFCQLRFDASGLLFTFLTDYTINCVHCIPQTSKSACKTAEKSAENNRKCTDKEQSRHKRGHLNFFTLSKLRKNVFHSVKCSGKY